MDPDHGKPHRLAARPAPEQAPALARFAAAAAFELAHREVERTCHVEALEGQRPDQPPRPVSPGGERRTWRDHFAEHRAREDMQHYAVVDRLEPPEDEHRGP